MFENIRIEGDFTLNSGRKSNYYYATENIPPRWLRQYAKDLIDAYGLEDEFYEFVATPAVGGVAFAAMVAEELDLNLVIIDKDDTYRGLPYKEGRSGYLIVDDVISTYGEVHRVEKVMGYPCTAAACLIFRGEKIEEDTDTYYLAEKEVEYREGG